MSKQLNEDVNTEENEEKTTFIFDEKGRKFKTKMFFPFYEESQELIQKNNTLTLQKW